MRNRTRTKARVFLDDLALRVITAGFLAFGSGEGLGMLTERYYTNGRPKNEQGWDLIMKSISELPYSYVLFIGGAMGTLYLFGSSIARAEIYATGQDGPNNYMRKYKSKIKTSD